MIFGTEYIAHKNGTLKKRYGLFVILSHCGVVHWEIGISRENGKWKPIKLQHYWGSCPVKKNWHMNRVRIRRSITNITLDYKDAHLMRQIVDN